MRTQFRTMKFRVRNPEESKALQEHLFKEGYHWHWGVQIPKHLSHPFLYTDEEGVLTYSEASTEEGFIRNYRQEMKLTTKTIQVVEKVIPVRENPFLYNDGSVIIDNGTPLEVIYRDGAKREGEFGTRGSNGEYGLVSMRHTGSYADIIAYRILAEEEL